MIALLSSPAQKLKTEAGFKVPGIAALGLGLACLGCCLIPMLGLLAAGGVVASIFSVLSSFPASIAILSGGMVLAAWFAYRRRTKACRPQPGCACGTSGCRLGAEVRESVDPEGAK
jgi:threonine/homoserine efflux transporter RhtA